MTNHHTPDFSLWASWPHRLDTWRNTPWLDACLKSIVDDATVRDPEVALEAQYALDTGDLSQLYLCFEGVS